MQGCYLVIRKVASRAYTWRDPVPEIRRAAQGKGQGKRKFDGNSLRAPTPVYIIKEIFSALQDRGFLPNRGERQPPQPTCEAKGRSRTLGFGIRLQRSESEGEGAEQDYVRTRATWAWAVGRVGESRESSVRPWAGAVRPRRAVGVAALPESRESRVGVAASRRLSDDPELLLFHSFSASSQRIPLPLSKEEEGGGGGGGGGGDRRMAASTNPSSSPCAACKLLRRKCLPGCIFSPYFPPEEPHKFANVHKVFGASNVTKLLNELHPHQREDAVNSLAYEAEARIKDPVYGCVGAISVLQRQVQRLQKELAGVRAELLRYTSGGMSPAGGFPVTPTSAGRAYYQHLQQQSLIGIPSFPNFLPSSSWNASSSNSSSGALNQREGGGRRSM
ncbi:Protein lateral organ boundaries [Apostasia shenzhenica]|uniref:Protein lateral organ boundaries n=1 Tax=Apostasia shenzhenica TaxID=1088818 RepID=A0A2I0AVW1_9ASPA|nr:Protein lateral organ boundaries [Apostasia shenzhenica]